MGLHLIHFIYTSLCGRADMLTAVFQPVTRFPLSPRARHILPGFEFSVGRSCTLSFNFRLNCTVSGCYHNWHQLKILLFYLSVAGVCLVTWTIYTRPRCGSGQQSGEERMSMTQVQVRTRGPIISRGRKQNQGEGKYF